MKKTPHIASLPDAKTERIPLWLKGAYSVFMAILVPVYGYHYGWTNFLYFCDVALFVTWIGLWKESRFWISLAAVGILLPQMLWCVDWVFEVSGGRLTGMTSYMFDAGKPFYLRALSSFHGWLPWLLVFVLAKLGYDRRALIAWIVVAVGLCGVAYLFLPPAGAPLADPNLPRNVNYVFGMDDANPQTRWAPLTYLGMWVGGLVTLVYWPTHLMLKRLFARSA
jgi:hypothetical protein